MNNLSDNNEKKLTVNAPKDSDSNVPGALLSVENNRIKAGPKRRVWLLYNLAAVVSAFSSAYSGVVQY